MRFGELDEATGNFIFSNVRSGLIVGLVSPKNTLRYSSTDQTLTGLPSYLSEH